MKMNSNCLTFLESITIICTFARVYSFDIPSWNTTWPDMNINQSGGLPLLPNQVFTIYNASIISDKNGTLIKNPNGTYNHGPIIIHFENFFHVTWYNSPQNESQYQRVLYTKSKDLTSWSIPIQLFPNITQRGEENEPFFVVNDHMYIGASIYPQYPGLMRAAYINNNTFSDIFWLSDVVPPIFSYLGYKTYRNMSHIIQNDMAIYKNSLYNTSGVTSMIATNNATMNGEQTLYLVPNKDKHDNNNNLEFNQLMILFRVGPNYGSQYPRLFASTCSINIDNLANINITYPLSQCRPGTDMDHLNLVYINKYIETEYVNNYHTNNENENENESDGLQLTNRFDVNFCNWTQPVITTIPDAVSRSCVSSLPNGVIYLVGNQLDSKYDGNGTTPRQLLTLSLSKYGINFSKAYAIRTPPIPKQRYYGKYKNLGYQYPNAVWDQEYLYVAYSLNKEDLQVSKIKLSDIVL